MILDLDTLLQHRQDLVTALEERNVEAAVLASSHLSASRCAELLVEAPQEVIIATLDRLKPGFAGDILGAMPPAFVASLLSGIGTSRAFAWMKQIPIDRAADIVQQFPESTLKAYLAQLSDSERDEIRQLTSYKEGTVGSIMTTGFLAIRQHLTVDEAIQVILSAPGYIETRSGSYVLDETERVVGAITLLELLRLDRADLVSQHMRRNVIAVHVDEPAVEAAHMLRNRNYLTLAVLSEDEKLVGVLTLDNAIDILNHNVADQLASMNAASIEESFFTPPMGSVRMRLPWMAANIFLNLGAVFIISHFEDTIAQVALLAIFLPMITDMGGNVGIQALSVAIRSIALGEVRLQEFWRATRKEILIGLVNGFCLGLLFSVVAYVLKGNIWLGMVAGIALACNVFIAGVIGGTLPFLIKRLGKDPAMMTGPVLTTITDITGVTIYLGLSTLFLASILGG